MKRLIAIVVALLLGSSPVMAEPEPPTHITVPTTVSDAAGHTLELPPGYFITEDTWTALDVELKRLQEHETRLAAENESFRASASAPRALWVVVGVAVGIAGGFAAARL